MKTQMKFQKYICLVMLLLGALSLLYAFFYMSGGMAGLGQSLDPSTGKSTFTPAAGKNDYSLFEDIQPFNDLLMYCGIAMILTAVLLYITACHKRRKYYVTNFAATGICSIGNIVLSIILMVKNAYWRSEFLNVDFEAWYNYQSNLFQDDLDSYTYSESTLWFDLGFVVYSLMIVASIVLILNLVWKILLMQGEKKLLNGANTVEEGGATV